jgi:hypothetical protein
MLATEIHDLPEAYLSLLDSISLFRQCLTLQPDSVDAAFNLAQSLNTLGEYVSDDASQTSPISAMSSFAVWQEARTILRQVQEAQIRLLQDTPSTPSSSQNSSGTSTPMENVQESDLDRNILQETVITASTVIETLLSAIEVDIALINTSYDTSILEDIEALLALAMQLDLKDGYMLKEIRRARHSALRDVIEAQKAAGLPYNMEPFLREVQEQQNQLGQGKADPLELTELADSLVLLAKIKSQASDTTAATELQTARELYQQARAVLQNPLQRPPGTPSHHIPAIVSSILCSEAATTVALGILGGDPSAAIQEAQQLALQALDILGGPFRQASTSSLQALSFAKAPRHLGRQDYRTILATQEAALWIVRSQLLAQPSQEQTKPLYALLKGVWPDRSDLERAVKAWYEEEGNGIVSILAGDNNDAAAWERFMNSM